MNPGPETRLKVRIKYGVYITSAESLDFLGVRLSLETATSPNKLTAALTD